MGSEAPARDDAHALMQVGQCLLRTSQKTLRSIGATPRRGRRRGTDVREGREGVRLHATEILDSVYHHAGTDRDQQDIARNTHIAMTGTWAR